MTKIPAHLQDPDACRIPPRDSVRSTTGPGSIPWVRYGPTTIPGLPADRSVTVLRNVDPMGVRRDQFGTALTSLVHSDHAGRVTFWTRTGAYVLAFDGGQAQVEG